MCPWLSHFWKEAVHCYHQIFNGTEKKQKTKSQQSWECYKITAGTHNTWYTSGVRHYLCNFLFIMLSTEWERVKNLNFSFNENNNGIPFSTRRGIYKRYKNKKWKIKRKALKRGRPNNEGSERAGSKEKEEKKNPCHLTVPPSPKHTQMKTEEEGKGEEERDRWEEHRNAKQLREKWKKKVIFCQKG